MTSFNTGDIILVPFPFTNQKTNKKRPAVVISSLDYNIERPDLIIMAVTSQIKPTPIIGEVLIQSWQDAGLLKPSVIKPVITTIEKKLVIQLMGKLKQNDLSSLQGSLDIILAKK
jgi:mRNA-degrading endonuclease toxin of MazEF toxin-antitoxin module